MDSVQGIFVRATLCEAKRLYYEHPRFSGVWVVPCPPPIYLPCLRADSLKWPHTLSSMQPLSWLPVVAVLAFHSSSSFSFLDRLEMVIDIFDVITDIFKYQKYHMRLTACSALILFDSHPLSKGIIWKIWSDSQNTAQKRGRWDLSNLKVHWAHSEFQCLFLPEERVSVKCQSVKVFYQVTLIWKHFSASRILST